MTPTQRHMERVASVGCVICRRLGNGYVPCNVHHVAPGSSPRSDWAVVGLCEEHHTGPGGFHKLGKTFLRIHRVPGESEYGLLIYQIEDIARYGNV